MFRTIKEIDVYSMTPQAQEQFENYYEDKINSNCYISHTCCKMYECETRLNLIDSWLLENGIDKNESILFHMYW